MVRHWISDDVKKAREEYKKTGKMNASRSCILINCQPAIKEYEKHVDEINPTEEQDKIIRLLIKTYQKKHGIGHYQATRYVVASAVYVSSWLTYQERSQQEVVDIFTGHLSTFRKYYRLMLPIYQKYVDQRNKKRR